LTRRAQRHDSENKLPRAYHTERVGYEKKGPVRPELTSKLLTGPALVRRLVRRQAFGDVDWDLRQAELLGCLRARVADDDHAVLVHDNRLTPTELLQARGNGIDDLVIQRRVAVIRNDPLDGPKFDLHVDSESPKGSRRPTRC
jgi:hypothetical protein